MAGRKEKLKPEQLVAALTDTGGLAYLAADRLGCAVSSVYNYARRYKVVADAIAHQKGKRLDTAEAKLWQAVLNGEAWAICFLLKTQAKDRGYVEKQVMAHEGLPPLLDVREVIVASREEAAAVLSAVQVPGPVPGRNGTH